MSLRRRHRTLVGLAAATLMLAVGACGNSPNTSKSGLGSLTGATSSPAPPSAGPTVVPTQTASPDDSPSSDTTTGGSGPRIEQFMVDKQPACPVVATADSPFSAPGQPVHLVWRVTGATGVALSVDDPTFFDKNQSGSYADFDPVGGANIEFTCDASVQPNTTHTYTLNTMGGGPSASKTLTVTVQTSP